MREPVDRAAILSQFDAEMRRDPPLGAGYHLERTDHIVRALGEEGWITYARFDRAAAPSEVTAEVAYLRTLGRKVEWKVYGHDQPAELGELLREAGLVAEPTETLMVFDLARGLPTAPNVAMGRVTDLEGLRTVRSVSRDAFGDDPGWTLEEYARRLTDPTLVVLVAEVEGVPVAIGRLEMPVGRSFASLWGGGTSPAYRGRGIYRALVAARAEEARQRGFRFLTVDAMPTSRPILERLGFLAATSVTGWVLDPAADTTR